MVETLGLEGSPFAFGVSFVPAEVLASRSPAAEGPGALVAGVCRTLGASFSFVDSSAPSADDVVVALTGADIAPMWTVSGPLWPVIERRGVLEGLRATLTHPAEIGAELDRGLDAIVRDVAHGAGLGARAIVLAEDLAGAEGPLVAPDFAIAELLPRYVRIVRTARALGVPAILHSDGDIRPLLPAIRRAGFTAVHAGGGLTLEGFERVFWAARAEGVAVIGGLLTAELGNAARAEALGSTIGVLAKAGSLVVADDGGITTAAEMSNLVIALAAARDT